MLAKWGPTMQQTSVRGTITALFLCLLCERSCPNHNPKPPLPLSSTRVSSPCDLSFNAMSATDRVQTKPIIVLGKAQHIPWA